MSASGPSSASPPAPGESAASKLGRADKKKKGSGHPWRENIEAVTMAIVVAIFLKYFVVEAYKIPTGSMQPTLMGNPETGIFDRILVDKLSYHYRDPVRFEVAVFKFPLDRSKNFIKRIWGMPDEWIWIKDGDVLQRKTEEDPWKPARRPERVQRVHWRELDLEDEWNVDSSAVDWRVTATTIEAAGPGSARFPRTASSVTDRYFDGYPPQLAKDMKPNPQSGLHQVGDLRLQGTARLEAETERLQLTLREHTRYYVFELPGPAAAEDARPEIIVRDSSEERTAAEAPMRLPAGRSVSFAVQNLDDQLRLEVDGETLLEVEVPAAREQRSSIRVELVGGGGSLRDLVAYRDIYYTSGSTGSPVHVPADHYMMLGDNTQDSSDSREWQWRTYEVRSGEHAGRTLRGQERRGTNPIIVTGRPDGTEIYFRDELGERYVFTQEQLDLEAPEPARFVHRELIAGRALLVFWPFSPSYGVLRLKWIR